MISVKMEIQREGERVIASGLERGGWRKLKIRVSTSLKYTKITFYFR